MWWSARGREGRWYRGGEKINNEWSYSMLLLRGEERKEPRPFQKGKRACKTIFGFSGVAVCGGDRQPESDGV
jgi:hypothetical protein